MPENRLKVTPRARGGRLVARGGWTTRCPHCSILLFRARVSLAERNSFEWRVVTGGKVIRVRLSLSLSLFRVRVAQCSAFQTCAPMQISFYCRLGLQAGPTVKLAARN